MERELYDIEPLRVAIVSSVVSDLCKAIKKGNESEVSRLEEWMQSEWGSMLCEGEGEYIAERCREIAPKQSRYNTAYIRRTTQEL